MSRSQIAVVDAGSNTLRLQIASIAAGQPPLPVHSAKWRIRLAETAGDDGHIGTAALVRLTGAASEAAATAREYGAETIAAVATSAIRNAANRADVVAEVQSASGVRLDVLSGADEASLEFLAARRWYGWSAGTMLLLDIGGGSLEIACGIGERPDTALSLPLGAGRLASEFLGGDPPRPAELRALRKHVYGTLAAATDDLDIPSGVTPAATSSTFARLARLTGAPRRRKCASVPCRLDAAALRDRLPELATRTDARRAKLRGISRPKSRQLLAGAIVADAIMAVFNLAEARICPWALREGVLLTRADALTRAREAG